MATYTNQSKNTSTQATQLKKSIVAWDSTVGTWDDATYTWDDAFTITQQTKNPSTYTNVTKD